MHFIEKEPSQKRIDFDQEELTNSNIIAKKHTTQKYIMNEFTKLDPTVPRIKNLNCPNESCDDEIKDKEIIYIRYDDENMRYVYICTACDNVWTLDNTK